MPETLAQRGLVRAACLPNLSINTILIDLIASYERQDYNVFT
ncbi:MAG: hypothetical protein WCJ35_09050 [Planctomycetota bacterium]